MFRQATVQDVANNRVTRLHGRIVVVTRYYPRYLKRKLIHDYIADLAPLKELLSEFKATEEACGDHDQAFELMRYEEKFALSADGLVQLARLTEEARAGHVYLVCHCAIGQACHRELLMLIAEALYAAPVPRVSKPYDTFRARLLSDFTIPSES